MKELILLKALIITIIIETSLLILAIRFSFKIKPDYLKLEKIIFAGTIATFSTLPFFWFVISAFFPPEQRFLYVLSGEIFVTFVETIIYEQVLNINIKKAFYCSLVCNLATYYLGNFYV